MQSRYQERLAIDVTYLDQCNTLFQSLSRVSNLIVREAQRSPEKSFRVVRLCSEVDYQTFYSLMSKFKVRGDVCASSEQHANTDVLVLGHMRKTLLRSVKHELADYQKVKVFAQELTVSHT